MKYGRTSIIAFASQLVVSFSGFFGTVVLTRVLGRDQYGTYVVVMSVLAWAAVAGNLGISSAVRKRVSEDDGVNYVIPGALSQLGLYGVVAVVLWFASPYLDSYMGTDATIVVIALLFVRLLFSFIRAALDGQHLVHVSSILQPVRMGAQSIAQIALVISGFGLAGAFAGYFAGSVVAVLIGAYFVSARLRVPSVRDFRRIREYAQYSWFAHLRGKTFMSMDTLILAFFVTNSVVGGYKAAWNLASIFAMFSLSIRQTLFPEISTLASNEDNHGEIENLLRESLTYAGLFIIPGVLGSVLIGDIILRVYGSEFASGYYILIILGLARLLYGYQSQFLSTIDAMDRPELTFRINVVFVALNLLLNVVLAAEFGWYGAAFATAFSAVVGTVLGYRYLSGMLDVTLPFSEIGKQVLAALVMAAAVLPGRLFLPDSIPYGVLLAAVGGTIYFGTLLAISSKFRTTVADNLPFDIPEFVPG